jgi:sugar phosphate isomerase/epimerase
MHYGIYTDTAGLFDLDEILDTCNKNGITGVELGAANWNETPVVPVKELLSGEMQPEVFKKKFEERGIRIDALNCSGNPVHPVEGKKHEEGLLNTIKLASLLGVKTVVTCSGLPGGGPEDKTPNWVTTHWPPENHKILEYQWDEVMIPFWKKIVPIARECGVRIAFELHPTMMVYNLYTYKKLCEGVGDCYDVLGINMDPSHMMWMGGDGREIIKAVPSQIFHCHLKDVVYHDNNRLVNGNLDNKPGDSPERSWNFDTPGRGRDAEWWSGFLATLKEAGYDGILSFELEVYDGTEQETIRRGVDFMNTIARDYLN